MNNYIKKNILICGLSNTQIFTLENINNFYTIQQYYLNNFINKYYSQYSVDNIDARYINDYNICYSDYDFIIIIFKYLVDYEAFKNIQRQNKKIIFISDINTGYDFNYLYSILFMNKLIYDKKYVSEIKLNNYVKINNTYYCEWGVDTDRLYVKNKNINNITILIDHFGEDKGVLYPDKTLEILNRMVKYKKNRNNIKLKMYTNGQSKYGGFEDRGLKKETYQKDIEFIPTISYKENLDIISTCDIYILTHAESFGLDICLYAMAGNLILCYEMHKDAVIWKNNVNYNIVDFDTITDEELDDIILNLDKKSNFNKVQNNTYENTIGKCLRDILI